MVLFSDVDEVKIHGEGARHLDGEIQRQNGDVFGHLLRRLVAVVLAVMSAGHAQAFDRLEQPLTTLLAQDISEHSPQKRHVASQAIHRVIELAIHTHMVMVLPYSALW